MVLKVQYVNYKQKYYKCLISMNEFNNLPWWKKLFFKFDINEIRELDPVDKDVELTDDNNMLF